MPATRPISIAIAAMGGQGGGVLADWLVDVAEHAGYLAQSTSVPGVAQRTGATVYYIEIFPKAAVRNGHTPVMALMPVPGDVDVVIAGELMEAGRAMLRGFVSPDRTTLVASSHRDYALSEKAAMGDGRADSAGVLEAARSRARRLIAFDMASLAEESGSVISSVMLGATAACGALPFNRGQYEEAIRRGGVGVQASLTGFAAGFEHAGKPQPSSAPGAAAQGAARKQGLHPDVHLLVGKVETDFDTASRTMLLHGIRRLLDYQDPDYAGMYLDRLLPLQELDRRAKRGNLLTTEAARHLALWMSYEDTIRVAELKTRAGRFERLREEARAKSGEVVRVVEFLHPRVEEVCDTLPAAIGRAVLASPMARALLGWFCRGRRVRTTSLGGFLLLYFVSWLRFMRRRTLRFGIEDARVRSWLKDIADLAGTDYDLAVEVVRCQRLVKGYGETHERGLRHFNAIMAAMQPIRSAANPAGRLRELCESALADEHGDALQQALGKVA